MPVKRVLTALFLIITIPLLLIPTYALPDGWSGGGSSFNFNVQLPFFTTAVSSDIEPAIPSAGSPYAGFGFSNTTSITSVTYATPSYFSGSVVYGTRITCSTTSFELYIPYYLDPGYTDGIGLVVENPGNTLYNVTKTTAKDTWGGATSVNVFRPSSFINDLNGTNGAYTTATYIRDGEFFKVNVSVPRAGTYDFTFRVLLEGYIEPLPDATGAKDTFTQLVNTGVLAYVIQPLRDVAGITYISILMNITVIVILLGIFANWLKSL